MPWSSLLRQEGGHPKTLQGVRSSGPQLVLEAVRGPRAQAPQMLRRLGREGMGGQDLPVCRALRHSVLDPHPRPTPSSESN